MNITIKAIDAQTLEAFIAIAHGAIQPGLLDWGCFSHVSELDKLRLAAVRESIKNNP